MFSPGSPTPGSPVRKGAIRRASMPLPSRPRRGSMPHVVSQLEPGHLLSETYEAKRSINPLVRNSNDFLKPVAPLPKKKTLKPSPSLTILTTPSPKKPDSQKWDFNNIPHIPEASTELYTPVSMIESVFELPSAAPSLDDSNESPNSSAHSSAHTSFVQPVAELEDTSKVLPASTWPKNIERKKAPTLNPNYMEYKSSSMTSRAVLKVVDETIAAIESKNRELHARALLAEETAHQLQAQNSSLQQKLHQYVQPNQLHRPKTAPSNHHTNSQTRKARHKTAPELTPLSAFNATIDELIIPLIPHRPTRYQPYREKLSSLAVLSSSSSSTHSDSSHSNSSDAEHHQQPKQTLTGLGFSPETYSHSHPQKAPADPRPRNPNPNIKDLSNPNGSERFDISFDGTPISSVTARAKIVSLEEAKRRERVQKPLPPLGPMSPSVVQGVVEIGTGKGMDAWGRVVVEDDVEVGEIAGGEGREGRRKGIRGWSGVFLGRKVGLGRRGVVVGGR